MGILAALILTFTFYKTAAGIIPLFDMDSERTITAYFSALDLGFAALLLGLITHIKKNINDSYWRHWSGLTVGFVFLSVDESVSIHERIIEVIRDHWVGSSLPPHYLTAIIGYTAAGLLLLTYNQFTRHLSSQDRLRFVVAGAIFITGAFGFEAIGGYVDSHPGQWSRGLYYTEVVIEESMEMIGILLFVRALLLYLKGLVAVSPMLRAVE